VPIEKATEDAGGATSKIAFGTSARRSITLARHFVL
jgi:hypothetical protein